MPVYLESGFGNSTINTNDQDIDDAYITLSYATNLARHASWGMHQDLVSNAATSPLSVIAYALLIALGIPAVKAVWLLTLTLCIVTSRCLWILHNAISPRRTQWHPALTISVLATNPLLISTLGLETFLYATVFLLSVACFVSEQHLASSVTAGLLVLARPEGLIPASFLLIAILRGEDPRRFRTLLAGLALPCAWYFFSWTQLGSLVPETLMIKKAQASWGNYDFSNGLKLYFKRFPVATCFSLFPLL